MSCQIPQKSVEHAKYARVAISMCAGILYPSSLPKIIKRLLGMCPTKEEIDLLFQNPGSEFDNAEGAIFYSFAKLQSD